MNKSTKKPITPHCKKTLVRHPIQKLPKLQRVGTKKLEYVECPIGADKGKTTRKNAVRQSSPEKMRRNVQQYSSPERIATKKYVVNLQSPSKNTVCKLAKKVDSVEKIQVDKVSVPSELPIDNQVTKVMNFPADRAIFRDLIPLKCSVLTTHHLHQKESLPTPRQPLPLKDREPSLSEFYVPLEENECYFTSKTKLDVYRRPSNFFINNMRLYKLLQTHQ